MLKAAGVENLQSDLWWMPVQRPYNPNAKRMAEMMQADLAKVGINAELVSYRVGRVSQAPAGRRASDGSSRLDRRQWRSGQLLLPARLQRGRQADGPEHHRSGATRSSTTGCQQADRSCRRRPSAPSSTRRCRSSTRKRRRWSPSPTRRCSSRSARKSSGYKISPLRRHEFYGVDIAGTKIRLLRRRTRKAGAQPVTHGHCIR